MRPPRPEPVGAGWGGRGGEGSSRRRVRLSSRALTPFSCVSGLVSKETAPSSKTPVAGVAEVGPAGEGGVAAGGPGRGRRRPRWSPWRRGGPALGSRTKELRRRRTGCGNRRARTVGKQRLFETPSPFPRPPPRSAGFLPHPRPARARTLGAPPSLSPSSASSFSDDLLNV